MELKYEEGCFRDAAEGKEQTEGIEARGRGVVGTFERNRFEVLEANLPPAMKTVKLTCGVFRSDLRGGQQRQRASRGGQRRVAAHAERR